MSRLEQKIQALAGRVCEAPGAEGFDGEYGLLLADLRRALETKAIRPEECARLALLMRHLCVGRVAFLVAARQRLATEIAATN